MSANREARIWFNLEEHCPHPFTLTADDDCTDEQWNSLMKLLGRQATNWPNASGIVKVTGSMANDAT